MSETCGVLIFTTCSMTCSSSLTHSHSPKECLLTPAKPSNDFGFPVVDSSNLLYHCWSIWVPEIIALLSLLERCRRCPFHCQSNVFEWILDILSSETYWKSWQRKMFYCVAWLSPKKPLIFHHKRTPNLPMSCNWEKSRRLAIKRAWNFIPKTHVFMISNNNMQSSFLKASISHVYIILNHTYLHLTLQKNTYLLQYPPGN